MQVGCRTLKSCLDFFRLLAVVFHNLLVWGGVGNNSCGAGQANCLNSPYSAHASAIASGLSSVFAFVLGRGFGCSQSLDQTASVIRLTPCSARFRDTWAWASLFWSHEIKILFVPSILSACPCDVQIPAILPVSGCVGMKRLLLRAARGIGRVFDVSG